MAECIAADQDCEAMCELGPSATAYGSRSALRIYRLCAALCTVCGVACAQQPMPPCQALPPLAEAPPNRQQT
jgi:hypothetical protein